MDDIPSFARGSSTAAPPVRTLVLWSGGIDSTYTVWRLLALRQRVFTLHVRIESEAKGAEKNAPGERQRSEAQAIEQLEAALAAELNPAQPAPVHLQSSTVLPGSAQRCGRASVLVMHAAWAMASLSFTPWDRLAIGVNGDVNPEWHPQSAAFALRRLLTLRQLRAGMQRDDVPRLALWEPRPSKAAMLEALPAALAVHVASCLAPVSAGDGSTQACGRCVKCQWRKHHVASRIGAPARGIVSSKVL